MFILSYVAKKNIPHKPFQRYLFYWVHLQFNILDEQRREQLGPNRTCAEWILRNGGAVKWTNTSHILSDYNELPPEGTKVTLKEIDASNSSIMHNGFVHFKGCNQISKLILHKCKYLNNSAIPELVYLKDSLLHLQISSCPNITETGLLELKVLTKLNTLLLFNLASIDNLQNTITVLKGVLPMCTVETQ